MGKDLPVKQKFDTCGLWKSPEFIQSGLDEQDEQAALEISPQPLDTVDTVKQTMQHSAIIWPALKDKSTQKLAWKYAHTIYSNSRLMIMPRLL